MKGPHSMRLLIVARYFYPDNAIAAVRITNVAAEMAKLGHQVTVLCGDAVYGKAAETPSSAVDGVRVIRYRQGNQRECAQLPSKQSSGTLFAKLKAFVHRDEGSLVSNALLNMRELIRYAESYREYRAMRAAMKEENIAAYDAVFTSYGPIAPHLFGLYAKRRHAAFWCADFRDMMDAPYFCFVRRKVDGILQKRIAKKADLNTCVADAFRRQLMEKTKSCKPFYTVYNGYQPLSAAEAVCESSGNANACLSLCYTGSIIPRLRDFSPMFSALQALIGEGLIDASKVVIHYAGFDSKAFLSQAAAYQMEKSVVDHGLITAHEASVLQQTSDVFLIASWNRPDSQGILTGKFYEAIRAEKPILAVLTGDLPKSELYQLINAHHLGYCHEEAADKPEDLKAHLLSLYNAKLSLGKLPYAPSQEAKTTFMYPNIVRQLEKHLTEAVHKAAAQRKKRQ